MYINADKFKKAVIGFVHSLSTGIPGEYRMYQGGDITLYSSSFALMTLHYLDEMTHFDKKHLENWASYILKWQNPKSGLFMGPEIVPEELTSPKHSFEHVTMHLASHILPALHLLGVKPKYPLYFARPFLDRKYLQTWLENIDWRESWRKGNDLLFVGQFLLFLRDIEKLKDAQAALDLYFDWLDENMDSNSGLWGTDGFCDNYSALYGGYHQLLVYYYCKHPLPNAEKTIDLVLRLQHSDGGFNKMGGGGACEDLDAVDVLVNLFKRTGYRERIVQRALLDAVQSVLRQQMPDGGFVYRRGEPFTQIGIKKSFSPANKSNLFATWFRTHTIALACQILSDHPLAQIDWQFNDTCSMGWHDKSIRTISQPEPWADKLPIPFFTILRWWNSFRVSFLNNPALNILKRLRPFLTRRLINNFL